MNSEDYKTDLDLPFAQIERIMKNALEDKPQPKKKQLTQDEGSQRFESDVSSLSESSSEDVLRSQEGNQSHMFYSARHYSSKSGLPAKVSKEAKETMQECATEFLTFVTSEA